MSGLALSTFSSFELEEADLEQVVSQQVRRLRDFHQGTVALVAVGDGPGQVQSGAVALVAVRGGRARSTGQYTRNYLL